MSKEGQPIDVEKMTSRTFGKTVYERDAFGKWCSAKDELTPHWETHKKWEKRTRIITHGETTQLNLPNPLHLWDMPAIVRAVDRNTHTTRRQKEETHMELLALGESFEKTAVYISRHLHDIDKDHGKAFAETVAQRFFQYGSSLKNGKKERLPRPSYLAKKRIDARQQEHIDELLFGPRLAGAIKQKGDVYRTKKLIQLFRVLDLADKLSKTPGRSPIATVKTQPWRLYRPFHEAFLKRAEETLQKRIDMPYHELYGAIYRRGKQVLQKKLEERGVTVSIDNPDIGTKRITQGKRSFVDALNLDAEAGNLNYLREKGRKKEAGKAQERIIKKIQRAIASYTYSPYQVKTRDVVRRKIVNCATACETMATYLEMLNIPYADVIFTSHTLLIALTDDNRVLWFDPVTPNHFIELTDIRLESLTGEEVTVDTLRNIMQTGSPEQYIVHFPKKYKGNYPFYISDCANEWVELYPNGKGLFITLENNLIYEYIDHKKDTVDDRALPFIEEVLSQQMGFTYLYLVLSYYYHSHKQNEERVKALKEGIQRAPDSSYTAPLYAALAHYYLMNDLYEEAKYTFQKHLTFVPNSLKSKLGLSYALDHLGEHKAALPLHLEAYRKIDDHH